MEFLQPLHPKMIHFPIALFLTALFMEIVSIVTKKQTWHQSALIVYVLATLTTPVVVRTGMMEAERIGLQHPVLESHEHFALITMWVSLMSLPVLWFLSKVFPRWLRPVFVCLLLVLAVSITFTGYYGGMMVYEYGVGTAMF